MSRDPLVHRSDSHEREPWWAYPVLCLITCVLGYAVAVLATYIVPAWDFIDVWLIAWMFWINAVVYKIARRANVAAHRRRS